MKNKIKILSIVSVVGMLGLLASCNKGGGGGNPGGDTEVYPTFELATSDGNYTFNVNDTGSVVLSNFVDMDENALSMDYFSQNTDVLAVDPITGGFRCLQPGVTYLVAQDITSGAVDSIKITVEGEGFTGTKSYVGLTWQERANILGKLERYAQDTYLTGLPFCGDGQYVMYNERVQKGVENYITGYGFGIQQYGTLTAPLAAETNANYKMYYHTYVASDPHDLNGWDSEGNDVSDLTSYITSGLYGYKLNNEKTDYEKYAVLAKYELDEGGVVALDPSSDAEPTATKFKAYVKTGANGLKYSTNSKNPTFAKYNGREVKLEDYLTPFKLLLTQSNQLFRGAEMISETYARPIVGSTEYYNQTANGYNEELFNELVGVRIGKDEKGSYVEYDFTLPLKIDGIDSNLSSELWQPIPMDFIDDLNATDGTDGNNNGAQLYGRFSENGSLTPVDTTLSLGVYTLEYYEKDKLITYKLNPNWIERTTYPDMNKIEGYHVAVLPAAKQDNKAAFNEFLAGKLDSCSIPGDLLANYKDDPRTTEIPETTTWKVNVNACNADLWEQLFGVDGQIFKTPLDKYWDVKTIMSNTHFLDGLYYSIDRAQFAQSQNFSASQNYLSKAYYFNNPDNIYNETDGHKSALKDRYPTTHGYSLDAAKTLFKLAIQEEVEAGNLTYGTKENPTIITISGKWMSESSMNSMGKPITEYMSKAFNSVDSRVQLVINNTVAGSDPDAMYDALGQGQFDLGMGAITGMQMLPIDFMQVLCSDNRSGFCLNWGVDTSINDGMIYYDGYTWSYDALWEAATGRTTVENGEVVK